jgi:long-chain acyl-CoA synthetase
MTENCAISHGNQEERRHGTVGKVMMSVDAKFSAEGEILTRHKALMLGYFREPAMTAAAFTPDGFLKTGDMGVLDKDGFLTITGRIKDNFKTDKGKYVSPLPMELKLSKNNDIGQVCVVGMGIPQPIALIVLSEAGKLKPKEEIKKSLAASMEEVSAAVEDYERLKKAVVMKDDWTMANGMMTPTLKIKRNEVEKVHLPKYPTWYAMEDQVVWE